MRSWRLSCRLSDISCALGDSHALSATVVRSRQLSDALGNSCVSSATAVRCRQLSCALGNPRSLSATLVRSRLVKSYWFWCALEELELYSSDLTPALCPLVGLQLYMFWLVFVRSHASVDNQVEIKSATILYKTICLISLSAFFLTSQALQR